MGNGVPEWLVCIGMILMFGQGFLAAGVIYLPGSFWDGVRQVYSFGFYKPKKRQSPMQRIVKIHVYKTWESCERITFYVCLTTDEGFTIDPDAFQTGSVYTNFKGLTVKEARERALCTAENWGDLLRIKVDPYIEDGVEYKAEFTLETYTTQRVLNRRYLKNGQT